LRTIAGAHLYPLTDGALIGRSGRSVFLVEDLMHSSLAPSCGAVHRSERFLVTRLRPTREFLGTWRHGSDVVALAAARACEKEEVGRAATHKAVRALIASEGEVRA